MMNYLSRIATRSGQNDLPSLMPAVSFAPPAVSDPFMQDTDTLNVSASQSSSSIQHGESAGKKISPKIAEEIKGRNTSYIAKYIERTIVKEDRTKPFPTAKEVTVNDVVSEANTGQKDQPDRQIFPKTETHSLEAKRIQNESAEPIKEQRSFSAEPEGAKQKADYKKKAVEPLSVVESSSLNKKSGSFDTLLHPKVPKLMPFQPHPATSAIKAVNQEPKLVIGKITVEVVPPVNPKPTKIITRVVHESSGHNTSTNNKLSFGLGQL